MDKEITYEVQEQYDEGEWISSSYEVDNIDEALAIKKNLMRSLISDYPDVKFRVVRKTLIVKIME